MNKIILAASMALLISGCGKSVSRDELERGKPGYKDAKAFCSQCHTLPFPDQHPPAAWPSVVDRMEGFMQASKRKMPSEAERTAIIGYFQGD